MSHACTLHVPCMSHAYVRCSWPSRLSHRLRYAAPPSPHRAAAAPARWRCLRLAWVWRASLRQRSPSLRYRSTLPVQLSHLLLTFLYYMHHTCTHTHLHTPTHAHVHTCATQIDTRGAAANLSVASEYFDVTLSNHASLAAIAVQDAPQPIALLIPLDPAQAANPEPPPCNASEAAARLCSACDATDATLGRHNCSGHGTCVHGRCWCDALHRGPVCLQRLECRFWSEAEQAWSSAGLRTDNESAAGAAALAAGLLRCESSHLTEFAGFSLPTTASELLGEMQDLELVLPCADGFTGMFEWEQNPLLYAIVFGSSLINLLSLPFFAWRYRRRLESMRLAERRRFYGRRLLRSSWAQRAVPRLQAYGAVTGKGSTTAPVMGAMPSPSAASVAVVTSAAPLASAVGRRNVPRRKSSFNRGNSAMALLRNSTLAGPAG